MKFFKIRSSLEILTLDSSRYSHYNPSVPAATRSPDRCAIFRLAVLANNSSRRPFRTGRTPRTPAGTRHSSGQSVPRSSLLRVKCRLSRCPGPGTPSHPLTSPSASLPTLALAAGPLTAPWPAACPPGCCDRSTSAERGFLIPQALARMRLLRNEVPDKPETLVIVCPPHLSISFILLRSTSGQLVSYIFYLFIYCLLPP